MMGSGRMSGELKVLSGCLHIDLIQFEDVIRQAENAAEYFLESGEWRKMSSPKKREKRAENGAG